MMDGKIERICKKIIALTDDDYAIVQAEIDRCKSHYNPLKPKTSAELRALGEKNQKSLDMIKDLQKQLTTGHKSVGYSV